MTLFVNLKKIRRVTSRKKVIGCSQKLVVSISPRLETREIIVVLFNWSFLKAKSGQPQYGLVKPIAKTLKKEGRVKMSLCDLIQSLTALLHDYSEFWPLSIGHIKQTTLKFRLSSLVTSCFNSCNVVTWWKVQQWQKSSKVLGRSKWGPAQMQKLWTQK